jgi:hypothetical protein
VEGRVYVSLNGYRWDNFSPQLFVSEDEGETWARIGDDLPLEPINVIKEDPENENLLYVGTDHGLYVSLDRGRHFMLMDKDLPAVAVHDVVVHPRDKQLLVGTHGRSLFLADVSPVQQLRDSILQKELYVFELPKTSFRRSWGNPSSPYSSKTNEPDIALPVFSKKSGKVKISVKAGDLLLWQWEENLDKGLNYPVYHATVREKAAAGLEEYLNKTAKKTTQKTKLKAAKNGKYYLQKGSYDLLFEMDGLKIKKQLVVK